jgi:tetratricopeptide (TPR) repeat protein
MNNPVAADDPRLEGMYRHFARNLSDICQAGQSAGAAVILSTVASNLKDCAPLGSLHRPGLSAATLEQWQKRYEAANAAAAAGQAASAVAGYQQALALDDRYAELHYRLGQSLLAMGQVEAARKQLVEARDLDVLRFRTDSRLNELIRQVAGARQGQGVYLVDTERALEGPGQGIAGNDLFYEHVHLRFAGNYAVAACLDRQVQELLPRWITTSSSTTAPATQPSIEQCAADLGLTDFDRLRQEQMMMRVCNAPPFAQQFGAAARRRAARLAIAQYQRHTATAPQREACVAIVQAALRNHPDDLWLHVDLGQIEVAIERPEPAVAEFRRMVDQLPHTAASWGYLGIALAAQGKYADAEQAYRRALALQYSNAVAQSLLGCLLAQHKLDDATDLVDDVASMAGDEEAHICELRARLLDARGDSAGAERQLRRAIEIAPASADEYRIELAALLLHRGAIEDAASQFTTLLSDDPDRVDAQVDLASIAFRAGRISEVIERCRAAIATGLVVPGAHFLLARAMLRVGDPGEAITELRRELADMPDSVQALDLLAWTLSTHPDAGIRNGSEAIAIAQRLAQLRPGTPGSLDVLAAAYAENGQFDRAVALAQQAETGARQQQPDSIYAARIAQRLSQYRAHHAWREPVGN